MNNSHLQVQAPASWGDIATLMERDVDSTVQFHDYVTADPRHPMPDPVGDMYLSTQAAFYLTNPNEVGVSFELLPGHIEYLQRQGILKGMLIQLKVRDKLRAAVPDFHTLPPEEVRHYLGYPHGSLGAALLEKLRTDHALLDQLKARTPFATFENPDLAAIRLLLTGQNDVDTDISYISNNKAELRKASEKFGFKMPPGFIANDKDEFAAGIDQLLAQKPQKIWTKVATGSGGDLVVPLEVKSENAEIAYGKLMDAVDEAKKYFKGPKNGFTPTFVGEIHIEDLSGVEKVIANINGQAVVSKTGVKPIGYSKQRTSEKGEYLGNLFGKDPEVEEAHSLILKTLAQVGEWLRSIGYEGIFGIDIILVQQNGEKVAYIIDCNARPNASTSSLLLQNYLEAPYALNCNLILPEPITSFEQAAHLLSRENVYNSDRGSGVLPKMFRAIPDRLAHQLVKCDIIGASVEEIQSLILRLTARGIIIK